MRTVTTRDDVIRLGQFLKLADVVVGRIRREAVARRRWRAGQRRLETRRGRQLVKGDVVRGRASTSCASAKSRRPPGRRGPYDQNVNSIAFVKGHGTRNDFVLLPDPDGTLALTAELAIALCDRRGGIGADGVLRVVRSAADPDAAAMADAATWFMDYRNADGSCRRPAATGCGCSRATSSTPASPSQASSSIATRGGVVTVWARRRRRRHGRHGRAAISAAATATVDGQVFEGVAVSMGNPHLVCVTDVEVASLDLTTMPDVDGRGVSRWRQRRVRQHRR